MDDSNKKRILVNLCASLVAVAVQLCISFGVTPYVVETLGEGAYGFITLAINFTEYATLLTVAVNSLACRFISVEYNRGDYKSANEYFSSVFWFNVLLSVVIFFAAAFLIVNLEKVLEIDETQIVQVKSTFSITFLNLIVSFISTCYAAAPFVTNRMDLNAYVQIISKLVKLVLIVCLFSILTLKIYYVSISGLASSVAALLLYLFLTWKLTPSFSPSFKLFNLSKLVKIARSGLWMLVSNLSGLLLNGVDLLLADVIISEAAMGRLSISKQLPIAVGSLLGYLANVFTASLTRLVALQKKEELISEVKFTIRVLGSFLTVPFAGIIVFGRDFLELWLQRGGYESSELQQIYILMLLTLANTIVNGYMYCIHSLYIALDKLKMYSVVIFGCGLISAACTILLAVYTDLGVYAIAGTSTVVLCAVNLLWVPMYAEKTLEINRYEFLKPIAGNYVALLCVGMLFFLIKKMLYIDSWLSFSIVCGISAAVGYVFSILLILKKEEKTKLKNILLRHYADKTE